MDLTAMSPDECKQHLEQLILDKALQFGDFTLASGKKSSYYIDCRPVVLSGEGAYCLARCILHSLRNDAVGAVGGMAVGAVPIAGAVAAVAASMRIDMDAFYVRKEPKGHGMGKQVEGELPEGIRVAMVEDTVTTGGSTLQAIEALKRERDVEVVTVIVMVDRQEGAAEAFAAAGYDFRCLFTVEDLGVKRGG